jgi:hypothetical protein
MRDVKAGINVTITPRHPELEFTPESITLQALDSSRLNLVFIGTPPIMTGWVIR